MMNAGKLNHLIRKKSKEHNLDVELVYRNYMFEKFLMRISKSKYKDDFIVKGGFLIGSMIGIENRVTKDIDATYRDAQIEKQKVISIFNEISNIDCNDSIQFVYTGIEETRENFEYPGYRLSFDALLEKTRIHLKMDISTGDAIVPDAVDYYHRCMFEDKSIQIKSYSLETILSEKLEAIITWGISGTRMRDYYDIYVLNNLYSNEVDFDLLRRSFEATISKRGTYEQVNGYQQVLKELIDDKQLQSNWDKFRKSYDYAKDIVFKDIINVIENTLKEII